MGIANDNFWGYTCNILYSLQVRWVEAAICMPAWTTVTASLSFPFSLWITQQLLLFQQAVTRWTTDVMSML